MNKKETIISSVVQALVAINAVLVACGVTTFENVTADMLYTIVSMAAMAVAWAWGLWKNHNFTQDMVLATRLGRESKEKRKNNDLTVFDRMAGDGNDN